MKLFTVIAAAALLSGPAFAAAPASQPPAYADEIVVCACAKSSDAAHADRKTMPRLDAQIRGAVEARRLAASEALARAAGEVSTLLLRASFER